MHESMHESVHESVHELNAGKPYAYAWPGDHAAKGGWAEKSDWLCGC